uniref:Immediate early response 2 n=1 Tax=Jaculus jaculus TaxID=51337 RepID=A0A8C5KSC6_JACJA
MEVQKEAQRIMTLSVWKMYHSRMQRGGLRLHRSLQLSLVMRSARELYLSAKVETFDLLSSSLPPARPSDPRLRPPGSTEAVADGASPDGDDPLPPVEPMDTQEEEEEETSPLPPPSPPRCDARPIKACRKRRSSLSDCRDSGLVPSKKARLEAQEPDEQAPSEVRPDRPPPSPAQAEGAFPNLARVLQRRFSGLLNCNAAAPTATSPAPCDAQPTCRPADSVLNVLVRAVVAF